MGCTSTKEKPSGTPQSPVAESSQGESPVKDTQTPLVVKSEALSEVVAKSEAPPPAATEAEVQPAKKESEEFENSQQNQDEIKSEKQITLVEEVQKDTESDIKKDEIKQKEDESTTQAEAKANPAEANPTTEDPPEVNSAKADSDNSDTEPEAKDWGEPLLTMDGEHIRRHSDTTKKMFAQLAKSDDLSKRILKKDFLLYFRQQGATNLTSRRLYSKFNPENTGSMNFDEFQTNLIANTYKVGEEVQQ